MEFLASRGYKNLKKGEPICSDKIRMAAVICSDKIRVHSRIHDFRKAPFLSYNLPSIYNMLIHLAAGVH